MDGDLEIRPATAADEQAWRGLWRAYNEFYESEVPPDTTDATWRRILDPASEISCLVAVAGGRVIGLANHLLHARTWSERPACYLEDLFVAPQARGAGAGRALIERLIELSREHDWSPLYWLTKEDNATARALYDRIVAADGFVRYSVEPRLSQ